MVFSEDSKLERVFLTTTTLETRVSGAMVTICALKRYNSHFKNFVSSYIPQKNGEATQITNYPRKITTRINRNIKAVCNICSFC